MSSLKRSDQLVILLAGELLAVLAQSSEANSFQSPVKVPELKSVDSGTTVRGGPAGSLMQFAVSRLVWSLSVGRKLPDTSGMAPSAVVGRVMPEVARSSKLRLTVPGSVEPVFRRPRSENSIAALRFGANREGWG